MLFLSLLLDTLGLFTLFRPPPSPVWQFLLHLFSLPQRSGAWEPTSLICVPAHVELLLVCSCRGWTCETTLLHVHQQWERIYLARHVVSGFTSVLLFCVTIGPYRTSDGNQQKCMCVCVQQETLVEGRGQKNAVLPCISCIITTISCMWATYDARIYRFLQLIHLFIALKSIWVTKIKPRWEKSHGF